MRYPLVAASYILIHPKTRKKRSKYDRLRSAFGLESGSTPQIDTPLTSLSQITVRLKVILKSVSFPNSQIYGRFIG